MPTSHGAFVWYELMTSDAAAATRFYEQVIGWRSEVSTSTGMEYTLLNVGQTQVAGLMTLPEEACKAGARPGWLGYVAVDDVDAACAKVKTLGGAVHKAPEDIPGIGRFAIAADPQGAVICLFSSGDEEFVSPPNEPGHPGWRELYALDHKAAFEFYAAMFGWTKGEAIDMGPMGVYQLFDYVGLTRGGMMNKPPEMPVPAWCYYFNTENIDAAVGRIQKAGGQVVNGPMEVPGGMWIVQALDPQGAMFALVGPRAG